MKVFGCIRQGDWEGGIILVAANSVNEAFSTAAKDKDASVHFFYYNKVWANVDDYEQATHIISHTYPKEKWVEYEQLTSNVTEPQVILDEGYCE